MPAQPTKTAEQRHDKTETSNGKRGGTRSESDSFGPIDVPADKYWGAQTQRSKQNFRIGEGRDTMPPGVVKAFGVVKRSVARVNAAKVGNSPPPSPASAYPNAIALQQVSRHVVHLILEK